MTQASDVVHIDIADGIALVEIDNPPVNAAGHAVRVALSEAVTALDADPAVKVIALYGAGKSFIAGADIREFGKPPKDPWLPAVCNTLERCETPVIAILHGVALGGGLEVALGCHARVALPGTVVGFPEVTLGIIPGAGGTQRAPRLTGIPASLDLITTGRRIPAEDALALGLVDRIEDGAPRDVAAAMARAVLAGTLATARVRDIDTRPDDAAIAAKTRQVTETQPNLFSPLKCVEAVAASLLPIDEGLARERALYQECIESPQRSGLIHAFFAERAVAKIPERGAMPRQIASVGIVGGGTMGSGIATAVLLAGLPLTLVEADAEALERGRAAIAKNLDGAVKRGKLSPENREAALNDGLTASLDYAALGEADLIVEAAFEDLGVKQEIFAALDAVAKPGAVLASNTSYLDVNAIAAATARPEDVIGLHFFSPAHVMRLLEVVVADRTAPETVATGFALAKRLRKIAVRSGVCDGFIGNRIMMHYRKAADYLMLDGASPAEIDAALEGFGFAMGPFAVSDLAGLDIGWASRKRQAPTRPRQERYVRVADRICEQGWFGRKTGQGYYVYDGKDRVPNPEALKILDDERRAAGIAPRHFSPEDIVERYMTAMIVEAARVVEEGIAQRPIDVDAVLLFGYGFPRHHGGPLHYADALGAKEVVRRIKAYAEEDAHFWQVPEILARLARYGTTFAMLNEG